MVDPKTPQPVQQHVGFHLPMPSPYPFGVGPSFGLTTTPDPGWRFCNIPPCCDCVCGGREVYFSDNQKTWGVTGEYHRKWCVCSGLGWSLSNAKTRPDGPTYVYEYHYEWCGTHVLAVKRDGKEVARLLKRRHLCCACDAVLLEAVDSSGMSRYRLISPGCNSHRSRCGYKKSEMASVDNSRKSGGCCRCCCHPWARFDNMWISGPAGTPTEPPIAMATAQFRPCCYFCYPRWWGFDAPPDVSDDDRAVLLGFLLLAQFYARLPQRPQWSSVAPTVGDTVM
jgi:hypothetical protein